MRTWPFESNVMLAGLSRGIWMGAPADRRREHRGALAGASNRCSAPDSDAEMTDPTGEDRATGPAGDGCGDEPR